MSENLHEKRLRILVVENHPDTVKWLQLLLEDMGHAVGTAGSVAEARTALQQESWEVLISDIGLPDGTGWELLETSKLRQPTYSIAMSGFGMNADTARSLAAGFRHHLLKPFKSLELENALSLASREISGQTV
jgi:CheY-like chemotaxis protein